MTHWIFILGCNNSGTSLYNHLLAHHPDISRLDYEGQSWMFNPRSLERELGIDCVRLWTEQLEYFIKPTLDVGKLKKDWSNCMIPGETKYNLVKSPLDMIRSKWFQEHFKPVTFLGIVRNGYAVVASMLRHGRPLERSAAHWCKAYKILLEDRPALDRFTMISYEELAEQPQKTMYDVETFLGLKHHDYSFLDDYIPQRGWRHGKKRDLKGAIPGMGGIREDPISNRNLISKIRLTHQQVQTVYEIAGEMLDHFNHRPFPELFREEKT